jgi:hypothetical protein
MFPKQFWVHSLIYGLILSAVLILLQLLIYIFDIDMFSISFSLLYQLFTLILITWWMAYTSIKYRNKYLENKTNFLRCLIAGVIVGVLSTIILALYTYVFYAWFDPELAAKQTDQFVEMISSNTSIPEEQKDEIIRAGIEGFDPAKMFSKTLISMGIMNIALALIATLFVRKKEKQAETNVY